MAIVRFCELANKGLGGQIKYTSETLRSTSSRITTVWATMICTCQTAAALHTDDSVEIKYYDHPLRRGSTGWLSPSRVMWDANSATALAATRDKAGGPKQSFLGFMLYDRTWFKRDLYGLTLGGGKINNPGRYLVLLPPINGETAASAAINSPYFTENPGNPFKAWDSSITFDYMPKQWITFRWEYDYRHASVPYWTGHGGITPPAFLGSAVGTNNGFPTQYACFDGTPSATINGCGNVGTCSPI